jgi:signal transduction histidine kinase/CheY-like chemotaxis protein/CHASE3 domain sensor protein
MPSQRRTSRATGIVVGLTIAVLAGVGALLTISHSNSAAQQQRLVVSSYETISLMHQALLILDNAEIGQRSYVLSGDVAELKPYEEARLRLDGVLRQLEASANDDRDAERQVAQFRSAAERKLDELSAAVLAFQVYGRDATPPAQAARLTTDRLQQVAESYIENQRLVLGRRLGRLRSEQEKADAAGLLVLAGAFACLIAGMYVIVRGAGRLEEAQEQLTARSRLLQATLETLHDPIFVLDGRGVVAAWNESFARQAGWDPARQAPPTRERLLSAQSPTTRALLLPLNLDRPAGQVPATVRVSHDGSEFEVSRGEMPGGGAVVRWTDVTDKLRDEAALRQGQKMEAVGQLTGGLAHDFNNILQIVQANLDLMKDRLLTDRDALERLTAASAAAERGARLTQQLLAFARRQPLAPRPTNVARLVGDLAGLLRHALGERIALDVALADGAWNARIDPGQLENAILNLAINARDAMPDGGTVHVEVTSATLDRRYAALHPEAAPGSYVLIAVEDTGTGMAADVVAQAFDPFFTTKRDGKGTGLGLSMVYGFVRQSNGHIRIDTAPGQGTSVKMYLPRTLDAVLDLPAVPFDRAAGRERVLVVEDNEDVRHAVVDLLSGWGYRVVAAENPDTAAAILENDSAFDLLFTDVVMPGTVTAVELAGLAQRLNPAMAVLMASGYARDLVPRHEGSSFPMIAKPFRAEELAAKLQSVLASARSGAPPSPVPERVEEGAAAPLAAHARRVLLVEDEVVLRMSTADMLERLDCFVAAVGSGEEALKLLSNGSAFDLLLTDLGLPGMSGEELAAEVRRRHPRLPVVIASGYGPTASQVAGVRFISKPYSSIDLQQALQQSQ